jgi:ABC-type sugar transport system substrate-binding protein
MNTFTDRALFLFLLAASMPLANAKIAGKTVVGFSQIGAESDWRVANTKSIKDAAVQAGIELVFSDAQQKQENQLKAVKTFILQKVDVIVIAPVVTAGWHDVLMRAKAAGIPVIILDRQVEEKDRPLTVSFIGADFYAEGRRAAECLIGESKKLHQAAPINIIELRGTEGSGPAIERQRGFADVLKTAPDFHVVISENGDFKESLGKEIMQKLLSDPRLKATPISAVFAHNDNMALGAISALDSAGMQPGKKIAIVSVDAVAAAFTAMKDGKLNCSVVCWRLVGKQIMSTFKDLVAAKHIPRLIVTEESVFPADKAAAQIGKREY